ncbi:MAG: hypothetical protein ACLRPW_12120, partial [Intestinibacter sp.]
IVFSVKISKRREPKNTSIIIEFSEFVGSDVDDLMVDEVYDIFAIIMAIIAQTDYSFRKV